MEGTQVTKKSLGVHNNSWIMKIAVVPAVNKTFAAEMRYSAKHFCLIFIFNAKANTKIISGRDEQQTMETLTTSS